MSNYKEQKLKKCCKKCKYIGRAYDQDWGFIDLCKHIATQNKVKQVNPQCGICDNYKPKG